MAEINTDGLDILLQKKVDEDRFSGVALVHRNGNIIFEKSYGLACKTFDVPINTETKFDIGSLNKLFTKTAILQLMQGGLLDPDDKVGKYLQDFPEEIAKKVTIRQLITFTSGMGDYFNERYEKSIGRLRSLDDFVNLFIEDPLLFEPGENRHYSNAGYVVLGKIIEAISGIDYYEYIRKNIYGPAGMNDSDHYERDLPIPNRATGYTRYQPDGEIHPTDRRANFYLVGTRGSPAGGGYSTVRDLMRFDQAVENNVLLDPLHSKMVLRPLGSDTNLAPRVQVMAGGAQGLSAFYLKFFRMGYTVFLLSNYDPEDVEPLVELILRMFLPDAKFARMNDCDW
ncbi:MAG: serine hydrolase domain-containing protein [Candidatus Thorarchaeota archaeon]